MAVLSVVAVAYVDAQTDEIEDERERRESVQLERLNLARSMEPFESNLEEFEAAIALLDASRIEQETELESVRQRLIAARAEVTRVETLILEGRVELEQRRAELADRIVEAYTLPGNSEDLAQILSATDINTAGRRQAFLATLNRTGEDALDAVRSGEADLADLADDARALEAEILEQEAAEAQALALIDASIADIEARRAALNVRLDAFVAEAEALAAAEDSVTAEINRLVAEEDRRVWLEEQARIAAEREAERARLEALAREQGTAQASGLAETSQSAPPSSFSGVMAWPVQGTFTSGFGIRVHPITGASRMHNGIDVSANTGTPIGAASGGTVIGAGNSGDGYGNKVLINHGDGTVTLYAHMNSIAVSQGQSVSSQQTIGTVGSTGYSTGPHLHFEVRVNGVPYNPLNYLP